MNTKPYERDGVRGEVLLADRPADPMAGKCACCGERPEDHSAEEWRECAEILSRL